MDMLISANVGRERVRMRVRRVGFGKMKGFKGIIGMTIEAGSEGEHRG